MKPPVVAWPSRLCRSLANKGCYPYLKKAGYPAFFIARNKCPGTLVAAISRHGIAAMQPQCWLMPLWWHALSNSSQCIESGAMPPSKNRYPHFSPSHSLPTDSYRDDPATPYPRQNAVTAHARGLSSGAHGADCQLCNRCGLAFLIRANNQEHKQGVSSSFWPQRIAKTEFGAVITALYTPHFMDNSSRNRGQKEIPQEGLKIIDE